MVMMMADGLEFLSFCWGLIVFIVPGMMWSYLLFKNLSMSGRLAWGFGITIVGIVSITMLSSNLVTVTSWVVFLLTGIFAGIPIILIIITRPELMIRWPDRYQALRLLVLLSILAFVAIMTYLPHFDNDYRW